MSTLTKKTISELEEAREKLAQCAISKLPSAYFSEFRAKCHTAVIEINKELISRNHLIVGKLPR